MNELMLDSVNWVHWLLAYSGLLLHVLMKLEKGRRKEDFTWRKFVMENVVSTVSGVISIPVLMVVCSEEPMRSYLPITYMTAVFLGYQSRSVLKMVMDISKRRADEKQVS